MSDGEVILVRGGRVFDGTERASIVADVLVRDGLVAAIGLDLPTPDGATVIDAAGRWVAPGFVDLHTHYDAEVELAPALGESVRHGVTTVLVGSCGLDFAMGTPEDLADQFCRVTPARSRWHMTVVRCTPYSQASASMDAPSRYSWTRPRISASDSRRRTGFESRPISFGDPAAGRKSGPPDDSTTAAECFGGPLHPRSERPFEDLRRV